MYIEGSSLMFWGRLPVPRFREREGKSRFREERVQGQVVRRVLRNWWDWVGWQA